MTTGTTRGPYAKTAQVREQILDAAVTVFAASGFHGATMKDVARQAGVSYTGLLHHFARKEDLLAALLQHRDDLAARALGELHGLDPEQHPLDTLRAVLAMLEDVATDPSLQALHAVLAGEAAVADHPARPHYDQRYRWMRDFYTIVFGALAARGELRSGTAPGTLASLLIAVIDGLQAQWLYEPGGVDVAAGTRAFLITFVPALAD